MRALDQVRKYLTYSPEPVMGPDGFVETLGGEQHQTFSQRTLVPSLTAWSYDRIRDQMMKVVGMRNFATEVTVIAKHLQPQPCDVVLDLACGHGNFTVEWAKAVGPPDW